MSDLAEYRRTVDEIDSDIAAQQARLALVRKYQDQYYQYQQQYQRFVDREQMVLDVLLEERQAAVS